jgi:hypothetical protein
MADKIEAVCRRQYYPASKSSGSRRLSSITLVVMHSAEAMSAAGVARYFQSSAAGGSAHITVDDKECQRSLPNSAIPWGAPGANRQGFHIEQCGYARWSREEWLEHDETLRRAAYKAALHCVKFDIPTLLLKAPDLKRGKSGITTHVEVSRAFGGSDHWDPGKGWPAAKFMAYVRTYAKSLRK